MAISQDGIKKRFNFNIFCTKLDRVAAWTLLVVMLAYALTGYGLTKGLIDRETARFWHLGWLGAIGLLAFIIHTAWAIHNALRRWRLWNKSSRLILWLVYLLLAAAFLYVHFFYTASGSVRDDYTADLTGGTISSSLPLAQGLKAGETGNDAVIFTEQDLSSYDGLNGRAAYAAVDGLVYDFSSLFRNGRHDGHKAGQDLSVAFHGYHPDSLLKKYVVVGIYKQ